jgi:outer membrane lipoprotein LolB
MRVAWLLLAAFLAGCAQVEIKPPAGPLEFELAGRIAARYGKESFTGNIAWRHAKSGDELLISGPTGQGMVQILRQGEAVMLKTAEPREYRASDAESLTERVLGFRLPLEGLADWVRARAAPGPSRPEYALDGRLARLEQGGWSIEYQEYAGQLPSRMRLVYQGIELRLAISQWN